MKKSLLMIALAAGFAGEPQAKPNDLERTEKLNSLSILAEKQRQQRSESSSHNKLESLRLSNQSSTKPSSLSIYKDGNVSMSVRTQDKKLRATQEQKSVVAPKKRGENPQKSASAFGFSFYSAGSSLNQDLDGDLYYSDFSLTFDADFDDGSADVYAVIYYSRDDSEWTELAETDVFNIYLDDASDEYTLSTTLNFGFPTGDYDILIDLYEDGVSGIVATISSDDVDSLYALPLEDREHEAVTNSSQISFVATDLFGDVDGDAFYTDLALEYDIDAQYSGDIVYAEIIMTNTSAGWQQRLTSNDFELSNSTEFVDLTFNSGYPPGYYDVRINLINAFTGEVITDAGREFSSLNSLPIESVNYDDFYDDLTPDVDVRVSGGGSLGWGVLLLGSLMVLSRSAGKRQKNS